MAERVLNAFRERPGIPYYAAKTTGVDIRTAQKAWREGLRTCDNPKFHAPFQEIVEREQVEARARLEREQQEISKRTIDQEVARRAKNVEEAQLDATESRAQESRLVRGARANVTVLLQSLARTNAALAKISARVQRSLEKLGDDPADLTIQESATVVQLLNKLSTATRQAVDAGQKIMEMERLLLGEPTSITAHIHADPISLMEAREKLEAAQRTIATLAEDGVRVIDGNPASLDASFS